MRALISLVALLPAVAHAQIVRHPDGTLNYVFPAGGQRGQAVPVEFGAIDGLDKATGVLVEGPAGVTVKEFKAQGGYKAQATLVIAADAVPGPRLVRVVGGSCGLTSVRPFFVGTIPEVVEKEPNGSPAAAHEVAIPAVVNGRLDPALDTDCFLFRAKAGQRIVGAVLAEGMDSRTRTRGNPGYVDTSLELLDESGKVLAAAEDTLGLDPLIEFTVPADGRYTVRVQSLGFDGSPSSVYRLTLGDVPYPTAVFPTGGRKGQPVNLAFSGANVPTSTRRTVAVPDTLFQWHTAGAGLALTDGRELPFLAGDHPEVTEAEPNDGRELATQLPPGGVTVNGRFGKSGDADWYRIALKKGQGVLLEVAAQRHLRSPVDTALLVTDAAGKTVAENDDGDMFAGQCEHDFPSADSRLEFSAPADGDYFVRVTDQGGAAGPRAVYRLTAEPLVPDFRLHQWPDAVPVWGPGTTAAFVVQVQRWGGLTGDLKLRIEGLPKGWTGSSTTAAAVNYVGPRHGLNQKVLLTITAPPDAKVGDMAEFRVVGRVEETGRVIERTAHPQSLLGSSHTDRMHLRYTPVARAAVAPPLVARVETSVKALTVEAGGTVNIPVKVYRAAGAKTAATLSVDGETVAASSAWRTQVTLKPDETEVVIPMEVKEKRPGTYGIVVSRGWATDLRAGRPGPCTQLITLHVTAAKGKP